MKLTGIEAKDNWELCQRDNATFLECPISKYFN